MRLGDIVRIKGRKKPGSVRFRIVHVRDFDYEICTLDGKRYLTSAPNRLVLDDNQEE